MIENVLTTGADSTALGVLVFFPNLVVAMQPINQIGNMGSQTPLPPSSISESELSSTWGDGAFIGESSQFTTLVSKIKILKLVRVQK